MVYAITSMILAATVAAFFVSARRGLSPFGWIQWALRVVAALPLLVSGLIHFTRTTLLATIIPPCFSHRPLLVLLSGAMELAGAIG